MAQILLVGTATLDLIFGLERHPHPDEEMRAHSLRICRGGNAANTAVVLSRLGHAPEFLGVLADAPETTLIEGDFAAHGVGCRRCPRKPGNAPTSSIYLTGSRRSIVHYRDLPELDAQDVTALDFSGCDWLHFEGRNVEQLAHMLSHIRGAYATLPVSLELEKPRDGIGALFGLADVLLCSRGFARHYGNGGPHAFLTWMQQRAPGATIVLAWGEGGAYGLVPGGQPCHAPAMPPSEVVDALGAGDTFNAAMIDSLVAGASLQQALTRACALAGRKCGMTGFAL